MIQHVYAIYFSPNGHTKQVTEEAAQTIGEMLCVNVNTIDFTLPQSREGVRTFTKTDLAVFGVPTYAGRIPNKILPFVQTIFKGNKSGCVPVVTYGNRSFDNSLTELCLELSKNGFIPIGAAAVPTLHVMSGRINAGRPDEADLQAVRTFASDLAGRLQTGEWDFSKPDSGIGKMPRAARRPSLENPADADGEAGFLPGLDAVRRLNIPGDCPPAKYYQPLRKDGEPAKFLKAKPKTKEDCIRCGHCVRRCPMGSIRPEDPAVVSGICIKCHACVRGCPKQAKYFDDADLLSHIAMLEEHYSSPSKKVAFYL